LRVDEAGERLFSYDSKGNDPTLRLWNLMTGDFYALNSLDEIISRQTLDYGQEDEQNSS
jgi:hypothetical protein